LIKLGLFMGIGVARLSPLLGAGIGETAIGD
jgi:hypothetical protein